MSKYKFKCPLCKQVLNEFRGIPLTVGNVGGLMARSRRGEHPSICPSCGEQEAMDDLAARS